MVICCCDCKQDLSRSHFGKAQLKKAPNLRRCKQCVVTLTGALDTSFQDDYDGAVSDDIPSSSISISNTNSEQQPVESTLAGSNLEIQQDNIHPQKTICTNTDLPVHVEEDALAPAIVHLMVDNEPSLFREVSHSAIDTVTTFSYDDTLEPFSPAKTTNEESLSYEKVPISLFVPTTTSQTNTHLHRHRICTSVSSLGETSPTPSSPHLSDDLPVLPTDDIVESSILHAAESVSISRSESVVSSNRSSVGVAAGDSIAHASSQLPVVGGSNTLGIHGSSGRVRIGICAMDKKARSKPMAEILNRLDSTVFEFVFFGDKVILYSPVEDWPLCDVLIAFYSSGYPLEKAERYADLRKPFVLNDLKMQWVLKDRRKVYDLLKHVGIDVPRHVFMNRDGYVSNTISGYVEEDLIEHDDHIEVNGVIIHKPFVEKVRM